MAQTLASSSRLCALGARWQVLSRMLVALARQVTLARKMRASAGIRRAELLEAALFAALVQLSKDIAEAGRPQTAGEELALKYLQVLYALFGAMALMMRLIRAELESVACRWADLFPRPHALPTWAEPAAARGFLDSG